MPQPPQPRFGTLLTEAISSISRRKHVNMEIVEEDLAIAISESESRSTPLTFYTVQRWMRGYTPDCQRIKIILEFCTRHGRISRDLAEGLLKHADCEHLLPSLDNLFGQRVGFLPPRVYSNLPRRNPSFRGRENELTELIKRLSPENRAAVIVIYGLGGIGKTTLATEAAHSCVPGGWANFSSPYEAVIFTSARDRTLTLAGVLDEIGRVLEIPAVLRESAANKMPLVQDILRRLQILLIIDNFETINDLALTRFALEGVPAQSKVVITTRDYHPTLWPGTWPIHLRGLADTEGLQLVREWAQEHEVEILMNSSDADLEPLLRATEGNPYALLTALGLIANQKQPLKTVLRDLWDGRGRIFDYIFSEAWELLEEPERDILMIMPFFTASATSKAIGASAGVEGYSLSKGIGRLAELSLVIPDGELEETLCRYSVHPLTRAFASEKLRETAKFEEQARMRWCEYYLQFAELCLKRDLPTARYWTALSAVKALTLVDPEWPNLLNVLMWAHQNRQDRILIDLTIWLVHYMDRRIFFLERRYFVRNAAEAAGRLGQKLDEALLRIDGLVWTLIEEGRLDEAKQEIIRGLQIVQSLHVENPTDAKDLTALAHAFLARVYLEQGGLDKKALKSIKKAMQFPCQPWIQSRVTMIAGDVARRSGKTQEAIRLYKTAFQITRHYDEGRGSEFHYRLGFAYLDIGDLAQAEYEFIQTLERQGVTIEDVHAMYGLARVAKSRGDIDRAYQWAQEARAELFRQHPALPLLNEIDNFVESLETSKSQGELK